MRIAGLLAFVAVCSGVLLPTGVWAQYEEEGGGSKFNLRLGYTRLIGKDDRALTTGRWYTEEVMYDYKRDDQGHTVGQLALGMSETSRGSDGQMLFVGANRLWWKDAKGNKALFGGAGIGAYRMSLAGDKTLTAGGQLFGGYKFSETYFVELRLTLLPAWKVTVPSGSFNVNFSSFTLSIGTTRLF